MISSSVLHSAATQDMKWDSHKRTTTAGLSAELRLFVAQDARCLEKVVSETTLR